jgi:hypothetical protein
MDQSLRSEELELAYSTLQKTENLEVARVKFQDYSDTAVSKLIQAGEFEQAFRLRKKVCQMVTFTHEHPLYDLPSQIALKKSELNDRYSMTAFSGFGGSIVKSGHLSIDKRTIETGDIYYIQFKLNPFARDELSAFIEKILCSNRCSQALLQTYLPETLGREIAIGLIKYSFRKKHADGVFRAENGFTVSEEMNSLEFVFEGKGRIVVGNNSEIESLYNNVDVELNGSIEEALLLKTLYDMLAVIGLGAAIMPQNDEDDQRMKIAKLFRTFYPREACTFEKTKRYYSLTPARMKGECVVASPNMRDIFQKYLVDSPHLLQAQSIYSGKLTWSIMDLSEQLRQLGAVCLYANIYGSFWGDKIEAVVGMVKQGARSTEHRFRGGNIRPGISTSGDLNAGSGDQVFTRLITCHNSVVMDSGIAIVFDLEALNQGAYAYPGDTYGNKKISGNHYPNRQNLLEFAANHTESGLFSEVMVKHQISPQFIKGIIVTSEKFKGWVIEEGFTKAGMIQDGCINGIPIDAFVRVNRSGYEDPIKAFYTTSKTKL